MIREPQASTHPREWRMGYSAGFDGKTIQSCPYRAGMAYYQWLQGFYAGRDRREVARTRRF